MASGLEARSLGCRKEEEEEEEDGLCAEKRGKRLGGRMERRERLEFRMRGVLFCKC